MLLRLPFLRHRTVKKFVGVKWLFARYPLHTHFRAFFDHSTTTFEPAIFVAHSTPTSVPTTEKHGPEALYTHFRGYFQGYWLLNTHLHQNTVTLHPHRWFTVTVYPLPSSDTRRNTHDRCERWRQNLDQRLLKFKVDTSA